MPVILPNVGTSLNLFARNEQGEASGITVITAEITGSEEEGTEITMEVTGLEGSEAGPGPGGFYRGTDRRHGGTSLTAR